jgi:SAM-dependent methyltransferase
MNPEEIEAMRAKYNVRLAEFGHSPRALGWNKPKEQLRYHVLLDYWKLDKDPPAEVLDFGCGFGDLYGFAQRQRLRIDYHGIDINPKLIEVGSKTYPEARLTAGDPINDGFERDYDIIVASGAHNYAVADNLAYIRRTFELFAKHARRGFAINFLSGRVNFRRPENYYADPEAILALALLYSNRVLLRHDYMPFEFTVIVDANQEFSERLTVFRDYEHWCAGDYDET